jgi:hypothetical protein
MKRTQARVTRKLRQAKRAARLQQQAKELRTIARSVQREGLAVNSAGSFLLGLGLGFGLVAAVAAHFGAVPPDLKPPGLLKGVVSKEDAPDDGKDLGA